MLKYTILKNEKFFENHDNFNDAMEEIEILYNNNLTMVRLFPSMYTFDHYKVIDNTNKTVVFETR